MWSVLSILGISQDFFCKSVFSMCNWWECEFSVWGTQASSIQLSFTAVLLLVSLKNVSVFMNFYCLISLWNRHTKIFPIKRNLSSLFCKLRARFFQNIQIQRCFYFLIIILLQSLNHDFIPDDFFCLNIAFLVVLFFPCFIFPYHFQSFSIIMS